MPELINPILRRIKKNSNFLAIISGKPGAGKSWFALSMAEKIDPNFSIDRVIFKPEEFIKLINSNDLKPGSCIVVDEAGVINYSRRAMSNQNVQLNFLAMTFRHRNYVVLFCVPDISFVDSHIRKLLHAHFLMRKIDHKRKMSYAKPYLLKTRLHDGKLYHTFPTIVKQGVRQKMVRYYKDAPSKELIQAYEDKKVAFTAELNEKIEGHLRVTESNMAKYGAGKLTEKQQRIYDLHKKGLKHEDIAKIISCSRINVVQTLGKVKQKGWIV